ncbi:hypothetical protein [Microbacterium hominis]|uniref:Uncharacterized protein n=1 Tax=Microbacterium hominis TaxID=162426 RepID=A0A7D4Q078_9MICO|nr:hypothetical protein [Microbacterium hominis]QKJ18972.1 hypothetical protein HQM25_05980 [Microbacterium hominis]
MSEIDDVAAALERLTHDPLADAVRGTVRVVAASEPAPRGRYQECRLDVIAEATGVPPTPVSTAVVTRRRYWPQVGQVLPARVSVSNPTVIDVDWDALAR